MQVKTISASDFLHGLAAHERAIGRHSYRAVLEQGAVKVYDQTGQPVAVTCGGTMDNRTVYVHVAGVGFIGGWQYPHKGLPWKSLVGSINRGILYSETADLPKRWDRTY